MVTVSPMSFDAASSKWEGRRFAKLTRLTSFERLRTFCPPSGVCMPNPIIAVVAFDGISPFHLSVPCLVFGEDQTQFGLPCFDFRVCALEEGPIWTEAGLTLTTRHTPTGLEGADIVILPSWHELDEPPPPTLVEALRIAHARGALLVGLCLGAFAIAATGLLSGRRATTHWAFSEKLSQPYPDIAVEPKLLYVDNGDVVTSAGVAAGLDCCLHIVRARYGAEPALRLARRIVLSPHRQGGQAQFIERPIARTPATDRFARALENVRATLGESHNLQCGRDSRSDSADVYASLPESDGRQLQRLVDPPADRTGATATRIDR